MLFLLLGFGTFALIGLKHNNAWTKICLRCIERRMERKCVCEHEPVWNQARTVSSSVFVHVHVCFLCLLLLLERYLLLLERPFEFGEGELWKCWLFVKLLRIQFHHLLVLRIAALRLASGIALLEALRWTRLHGVVHSHHVRHRVTLGSAACLWTRGGAEVWARLVAFVGKPIKFLVG